MKSISHKIISTWIAMMLLLPMGVQFVHSFENHAHNECNEKNTQHFHEKYFECEFNHFLLNTNASLITDVITINTPNQFLTTPEFFTVICNEIQLFSKSSRAPPVVII